MKNFATAVLGFVIISFHCPDSEAAPLPSTLQDIPYCLGFVHALNRFAGKASSEDWEWMQSDAELAKRARMFESTIDNVRMLQGQGSIVGSGCAAGRMDMNRCVAIGQACVKISNASQNR